MRNGAVVSLLAVALLAGAAAGYLVGTNSVTSATSQSSVATTSCTVGGPTIGAVVKVMDGGDSVAGAKISGEADGFCNGALQTQVLQPTVTNSSGWASLLDAGFGTYNLLISYEVDSPPVTENYHLSIPTQPTAVTYVIYNTATGNVTTYLCYYNAHCFVGG
jgi:hypothetical protein